MGNNKQIYLKPCPFCGSTSVKIHGKHNGKKSGSGTHSATVRCNCCHARGPAASCKVTVDSPYSADEETKRYAADLWNAR